MKTSDYPHYRCSFAEFNKAQEAVVPFLDKDVNLVVSFRTAVGKTALAECAIGYHLSNGDESKVIYISPYKSISSERQRAWLNDEQISKYGILLHTGDLHTLPEEYSKNRVIIMTSESLDSRIRQYGRDDWIAHVECVVFDEAHLLGQKRRGSSIEAGIMNITRLNPNARLILLSATMSNAKDIAKWIKSLNGKSTKYIWSDWRPVEVNLNYHSFDDSNYESEKNKVTKVIEVVTNGQFYGKTIVFVHSKRTGKEIARQLAHRGIRCAFHNASLSHAAREKIEKEFDDPYSGLNFLVSTSTLSSGVNIGSTTHD
jgi:helicase